MPIDGEEDASRDSEDSSDKPEIDDDEAVVEDLDEQPEANLKTKKVIVDDWMHLNALPPVWLRYTAVAIVILVKSLF